MPGPRTLPRRRLVVALVAATAFVAGGTVAVGAPAAVDTRPTAVVALGDSAISGEGAGDYEPGTDGPENFCHRSPHAQVHATDLPGIDRTINLACSGAASANLRIGGPAHNTEPSQADQLRSVATRFNVQAVVVQVGANDDPAFADAVLDCIVAWANIFAPGCRETVGDEWSQRVAAMRPKVSAVIGDIRTVMREAGYGDDEYEFVLESYSSPVTEDMHRLTHALQGCPIRLADAEWARTVAAPELADGLRTVAEDAGVRFLDLSRATEGREACNRDTATWWQNPIVIDLSQIPQGLSPHLVQQSFHPNAVGHAQIGGCLAEFVSSDAEQARCLVGADGDLHAEPVSVPDSR